jgi:hypothetical protein
MAISNRFCCIAITTLIALAGCSSEDTGEANRNGEVVTTSDTGGQMTDAAQKTDAFIWPDTLRIMGDGYPKPGDPCRQLGETAATSNYLDDSAVLIGCPGGASSAGASAITEKGNARVVGETDGVTLISVAEAPTVARPVGKQHNVPTKLSGKITGNAIATHRFTAKEGDTVNVTLAGPGSMYFNVLPPGGSPGDAIYVGSRAVDNADAWSAVAPATGDYSIIVYMMGNDKDSGATRSYELTVAKN